MPALLLPVPFARQQMHQRYRQHAIVLRLDGAIRILGWFNKSVQFQQTRGMPILLWNTSAGFIKDGQGTRKIEVDTTGAGSIPDREIVAQLWVGGYAPECVIQESASVKIIGPPVKFGEFGELEPKAFTENLKVLADYLSQSPDNLYVFVYAGRKSDRAFVFNAIRKVRDELVFGGVAQRRMVVVDGGFREDPFYEFWLVPLGAEPPRPTPTVRRDEIVYPAPTPVRKKPPT